MTTASEIGISECSCAGQTLEVPYLLINGLACYQDDSGRRWFDELWAKDVEAHLAYLTDFTIACPLRRQSSPEGSVPIDSWIESGRLRIVDLPDPRSTPAAIRALQRTRAILRSAISDADIVHTTTAGWPIPLGWIAAPIARRMNKPTLFLMESAAWRIPDGTGAPIHKRFRAAFAERMAKRCIRRADIAIFSQDGYRREMLGNDASRGHVIPASWIDEEIVLMESDANAAWERKLDESESVLRAIFAARLVSAKGVEIVLAALRLLDERGVRIELDIYGKGPLENECRAAAESIRGSVRVRFCGTVPYGEPFFSAVRGYHVGIIANLQDEQPRLLFDLFSQAVPVVGTDTTGMQAYLKDRETGFVVPPGDRDSLASSLERTSASLTELREMGMNVLRVARRHTHQSMHRERLRVINDALRSV